MLEAQKRRADQAVVSGELALRILGDARQRIFHIRVDGSGIEALLGVLAQIRLLHAKLRRDAPAGLSGAERRAFSHIRIVLALPSPLIALSLAEGSAGQVARVARPDFIHQPRRHMIAHGQLDALRNRALPFVAHGQIVVVAREDGKLVFRAHIGHRVCPQAVDQGFHKAHMLLHKGGFFLIQPLQHILFEDIAGVDEVDAEQQI